ncbi:hypothetical protein BDV97DRAFT_393736 [Delphinella strobiligena]|nr:hypothetical protein BDV97DRAFT_393736 [Delphinella strobiligena]
MSPHNQDDSDTDWDSIYDEELQNSTLSRARSGGRSSTKAREAANERETGAGPQSVSSQNQRPPEPTPSWPDERTPLLDAGPPPPAYSDIAANRPYAGAPVSPSSHRYGHTQQSAGEGAELDGGESGRTYPSDAVKRRRKYSRPIRVLKATVFLLALVLMITLTFTTWRDIQHDEGSYGDDKHTPSPVMPPNGTGWTSPRLGHCQFKHYTAESVFEFPSPRSFSFIELMEESNLLVHEIGGLITLTAPSEVQEAAVVVGITLATTEHYQISNVNVLQREDSLSLSAPSFEPTGYSNSFEKTCMLVQVRISIKPGTEFSELEVATERLNLHVDPSLFGSQRGPEVHNNTEFTTIQGDVSAAYWSSRNTIIDVKAGSVTGTYALRDLLSIRTRSGSINVDVEPQAVDRTAPAPADFTAKSISGSIAAHFPLSGDEKDVPKRVYRTHTDTSSGAISGSYILGSTSTFRTTSGSISAYILPYAADTSTSNLRTETQSGRTNIKLLSPFRDEGEPISCLHSYHTTTSSSLTLAYPQEWEGVLQGSTMSGGMTILGKDLETLSYYKGPGGKKITAKKGSGNSKMHFSTISGSVDATVGHF